MPEQTCPRCGAPLSTSHDEAGATVLTCTACSATWSSGLRRCRICGGTDYVQCEQRLTVTPRGTLHSVIGAHPVRLCPRCDAKALGEARQRGMVVRDDYRSRFLHGDPAPTPPHPRPVRPSPEPSTKHAPTSAPPLRSPAADVPQSAPSPRPVTDPTVRQAITLFLEASDSADATAMLLLGQQLGPGTRLGTVDTSESLNAWLERTYPPGSEGHTTIRDALEDWRRRGWLP